MQHKPPELARKLGNIATFPTFLAEVIRFFDDVDSEAR